MKAFKVIERYLWLVNFGLLFLLAYFGAGLVNFQLKKNLVKPAGVKVDLSGVKQAGFSYHPSPDKILEKNIFGTLKPKLTAKTAEGEGEEIPPTKLNAILQGIVYFAPESELNRATIYLSDEKTADVYKIGDRLAPGVKIASIMEKKVILEWSDGRKEELLFEFEKEQTKTKKLRYTSPYARMSPEERRRVLAERRRALGIDNRIIRVSETYYRIEKDAITEALSNLNDIVTQARLVPNFVPAEDGARQINGFRIFRIKPGSVFEKLGLRNGDVIQKINGVDMDSIEKGFQLLQQLRYESQFEIQIKRGARELTLSYEIVD